MEGGIPGLTTAQLVSSVYRLKWEILKTMCYCKVDIKNTDAVTQLQV